MPSLYCYGEVNTAKLIVNTMINYRHFLQYEFLKQQKSEDLI